MKYIKILAIMLGIVGMSSCSDDKTEYNSNSNVTVSMADTEITFKENKRIVKVPVKVEGEANGYITVTCAVSEYGTNVAMDDVHYLVTSKTINIAPDSQDGYFELFLVDDHEVNDPRQFTITLVNAQGAKISGTETTIITLADNDDNPYSRLGGEWYCRCFDSSGNSALLHLVFEDADEGEYGYNSIYTVTGMFESLEDDSPVALVADFELTEPDGQEGTVSIAYGQKMPDYDHGDYGRGSGVLGYWTDSSRGQKGKAVFTWNEDGTELNLVSWPGEDDVTVPGADFSYMLSFSVGTMTADEYYGITKLTRDF